MNDFFKSKTFIILLTLLVILGGVPAILGAMGQGEFVRDAAVSLLTPLLRGAYAVGDGLRGYAEYFTEFDRLKDENEALLHNAARARHNQNHADRNAQKPGNGSRNSNHRKGIDNRFD